MEWGPEIEVNGVRPAWLSDDDRVRDVDPGKHTNGQVRPATGWGWYGIKSFQLPADHWAYQAIQKGFEPWPGGDTAPTDWDGGEVLLLGAIMWPSERICFWDRRPGSRFVIGYRKKPDTVEDYRALWEKSQDELASVRAEMQELKRDVKIRIDQDWLTPEEIEARFAAIRSAICP